MKMSLAPVADLRTKVMQARDSTSCGRSSTQQYSTWDDNSWSAKGGVDRWVTSKIRAHRMHTARGSGSTSPGQGGSPLAP
jgi:hypothetical protein